MKVNPDLFHIKIESTNAWAYGEKKAEEFPLAYNKIGEKLAKVSFLVNKIKPYPNPEDVNYNFDLLEAEALVLSKDQLIELMVANLKFDVLQKIDVHVDITSKLIELRKSQSKSLRRRELATFTTTLAKFTCPVT